MTDRMGDPPPTPSLRARRCLIGVCVAGGALIAAIGFAGSYAAVRKLAERKGFGTFAVVFPVGIDAGIVVLLALDLLLTWMRIPFPLLRHTAWLLTAATIAFNGATAWPDPLGVAMHAVIPVLFVVAVEAGRHAIGRIADITADKHMDSVRWARWLLAPWPTFRLWRRMKLWELRSYEDVIRLEQERLVYRAQLRTKYGRGWRRKAPVEATMRLRLARYGVPVAGALSTDGSALDDAPADTEVEVTRVPAPAASSGALELLAAAVPEVHPRVVLRVRRRVRPRVRPRCEVSPLPPPVNKQAKPPKQRQKSAPPGAPEGVASGLPPRLLARARRKYPDGPPSIRQLMRELSIGQERAKTIHAALTVRTTKE